MSRRERWDSRELRAEIVRRLNAGEFTEDEFKAIQRNIRAGKRGQPPRGVCLEILNSLAEVSG